jgi:glycosyltransferase involved in cell wall biosynthesis
MPRLYCSADAYVMPTRGEGWGRPYIEAMACGLPVIGTRWSGQLAYMNDRNSYLIDIEGIVGDAPYVFAEPSLSHLRGLMRYVFSHRDAARRMGLRARQDVDLHWSWDNVARTIIDRLRAIRPRLFSLPKLPTKACDVLNIIWEGSQFVHHSLALINRELCLQLIDASHDVSIIPYEADQFGSEADERFSRLAHRVRAPLPRPVDFHVRHQWPPNFTPPPEGHWVMIQPWEYGRLPEDWVEPMTHRVDEIWFPSRHVLKTYLASGIPPDRLHVIPNGVNVRLFHPKAAPCPLPTDKKFKFLFVGGTIWRKGVDLLLDAYRSVFRREDDVVLVIKEMGQDTFYKGQGLGEIIRKIQKDPTAPEIFHLTDMLDERQMPGLFTACDCLVHPYRGEGFGLPVLEAMACGTSVVVTGGGATDDFCSSETAFLIPSQRRNFTSKDINFIGGAGWVLEPDLESLKATLLHVYNHPAEAEEKAQRAFNNVRDNYTWEKIAERMMQRMCLLAEKPIRRLR